MRIEADAESGLDPSETFSSQAAPLECSLNLYHSLQSVMKVKTIKGFTQCHRTGLLHLE